MKHTPFSQYGFALMDMLLAAAVAGLLIAAALPMFTRSTDDQGSKSIADDLQSFKKGAETHFLANRAAYEQAMADGTGAAGLCKVNVNPVDGTGGTQANNTTLHTCALDVTMLKYLQALPATFRANNSYGEQWVVVYRRLYNGATATSNVEAFWGSAAISASGAAVAANDRRYRNAVTAGTAFGAGGGAIPDTDRQVCVALRSSATYEACGDGWKVNLADFISSAQLTTFGNRLPN